MSFRVKNKVRHQQLGDSVSLNFLRPKFSVKNAEQLKLF